MYLAHQVRFISCHTHKYKYNIRTKYDYEKVKKKIIKIIVKNNITI